MPNTTDYLKKTIFPDSILIITGYFNKYETKCVGLTQGKMIMQGALIVFTGCIIYYLINQIYSVVRFRNKYIQEKARLLADRIYILATVIDYVICYGLLFSGIIECFCSADIMTGETLPFAVSGVPLIAMGTTIMLNQGSYAYSEDRLLWKNGECNLDTIQIVSTNVNRMLGRAVIKINCMEDNTGRYKKMVIRTTYDKGIRFIKCISSRQN